MNRRRQVPGVFEFNIMKLLVVVLALSVALAGAQPSYGTPPPRGGYGTPPEAAILHCPHAVRCSCELPAPADSCAG